VGRVGVEWKKTEVGERGGVWQEGGGVRMGGGGGDMGGGLCGGRGVVWWVGGGGWEKGEGGNWRSERRISIQRKPSFIMFTGATLIGD